MQVLKNVKWGFIGCGNVTEIKSGPAFNKIKNSEVLCVFRRDQEKLKDYASRHKIPRYYESAEALMKDDEINAVYIATPPNTHKKYTIMASNAGKAVYVEKPMALNHRDALEMSEICQNNETPLFVAHYRRYLPSFQLVKELIDEGKIGKVRCVTLKLFTSPKDSEIADNTNWRIKPEISGGGHFFDLAPHQLDILNMYFGEALDIWGCSVNQAGLYEAEDIVSAIIKYKNNILLNATWCFTTSPAGEEDTIQIIGEKGNISFSTFSFSPVVLENTKGKQEFDCPNPENIQLPTIESVVRDLLGGNTSSVRADVALETVRIMDIIIGN